MFNTIYDITSIRFKDIIRLIILLIIMTMLPTIYSLLNSPGKLFFSIFMKKRGLFDSIKQIASPKTIYLSYVISAISWVIIMKIIEHSGIYNIEIIKEIVDDYRKLEEELNNLMED